GPRRDLTAGMARTRGLKADASLVLAADTATDNGTPARSDRTWIFEPVLPRSTGLGPVMDPPFWPGRRLRPRPRGTSRSGRGCPTRPRPRDAVVARVQRRSSQ